MAQAFSIIVLVRSMVGDTWQFAQAAMYATILGIAIVYLWQAVSEVRRK